MKKKISKILLSKPTVIICFSVSFRTALRECYSESGFEQLRTVQERTKLLIYINLNFRTVLVYYSNSFTYSLKSYIWLRTNTVRGILVLLFELFVYIFLK